MKCIPTTLSGRPVVAASSVIEMELVLDARIASGPSALSRAWKTANFTAGFSLTASTAMSAPAAACASPAVRMRASVSSTASGGIVPFLACRSRLARIVFSAFSSAAGTASISVTDQPFRAKTCAIPLPMVPPPTTAACFMPRHPFVRAAPARRSRPGAPRWPSTPPSGPKAPPVNQVTVPGSKLMRGMRNGSPLTGASSAARVPFQARCAPQAVQIPPGA